MPSPLHRETEYVPSVHELMISAAIAAIGLLVLTALYKIVIAVKTCNQKEHALTGQQAPKR